MKKLELLKIMNQEQLISIIEKQSEQVKEMELEVRFLNSRVKVLNNLSADWEKGFKFWKEKANKRLSTLESIASQFNRSKGCTKPDEIINLKAQGNIFDRVNDVFKTDSNKNFIQNLTERIL